MRLPVLCLAGLVLAWPLAAQQHHPQHHPAAACQAGQPCPMHDMKSAEMAALLSFAPDRLLEKAAVLGLTKEQTAQLAVLRDASAKAVEDAKAGPMNHAMCIQASAALMSKGLLTDAQREMAVKK
jgi:hypothetical protein